jgi:outer membrane immunogenic protein
MRNQRLADPIKVEDSAMRIKVASLIAVAMSFGVSQVAFAADMPVKARAIAPPPAAFNWTGCYVGGYAGGAFAGRDATSRDLNGYNYGGAVGPAWSYNVSSSLIAGGTLGCNYEVNNWVFGAEGEVGYINVNGSAFDPRSLFIPLDTEARTKIGNWYGVAAGRVGYAWDRVLVYGKAGVAFANVEQGINDTNPIGNTIFTRTSSTKAALAVGAGLEYALANNWSIKGEYLYMDFRASDTTCGNATVGGGRFCWSNDFRGVHTAKIGLNYLFGMH